MQAVLSRFKKKTLLYLGIIIVAAAVILPSMYFYFEAQRARQEAELAKNNPKAGDEELKRVLEKVGRLVLLPEGETPTLATVTDKKLLSGQAFYKNAENGDKVLIYAVAKKAFLYRPSTNKIIEIAPVTVDTQTATGSAEP